MTTAFGIAEPQSTQLLVEAIDIDAIVGRVASTRGRRRGVAVGGGGRMHSVETDGFVLNGAMLGAGGWGAGVVWGLVRF